MSFSSMSKNVCSLSAMWGEEVGVNGKQGDSERGI